MHLFIFRSEHAPELSCYCSDARGAGLPERFAPWAAVGVLRQHQDPPHNLSRAAIEAGVTATEWSPLLELALSPGGTSERITIYRAGGLVVAKFGTATVSYEELFA